MKLSKFDIFMLKLDYHFNINSARIAAKITWFIIRFSINFYLGYLLYRLLRWMFL